MSDITAVLIGTNNHTVAKFAIENTIKTIPCKEVLVFSDLNLVESAQFHKINQIKSVKEYSYFCLKCLLPFITTSHILIIQYDGFATNPQYWSDEFFDYDYIGAPWVGRHWDLMANKALCVGNGGFSLRSKKLLEALQDKFININENISFGVNEDYLICLEYRKFLEDNYHIKFAPRQLAINFSNENDFHFDTFGFHGLWNMIYYLPEQDCINIFQNLPKSYWDKNSLDFLLKTSYNRNYTKLHAILLN